MIRWVLMMVLIAAHFILMTTMAGGAAIFVSVGAFLVVGVGTLLYLLATFRVSEIRHAIRLALSDKPAADEEWIRADLLLESGMRGMVAFGGIGFLIGLVLTLANLSDPAQLGPAMAISLLTVFYAMIFGEVVLGTLRTRIQRALRLKQIKTESINPWSAATGLVILLPLSVPFAFLALSFWVNGK